MRPQYGWISLAAVALSFASSLAAATAQRTFVSANGVNNANCSLVSPCRSFAAAMNATNAGGEVIVLDSAGYGLVTITQSVSIIAPPGIYAGISVSAGHDGVTINAPGATVVLRGLSINGQGGSNGILVQQAARVRIESCIVSNMGAVGIYHTGPNAEMIVLDTIVRDNVDGLGLVASNASILLDHVRSEHNQNGGFYIAPTPGSSSASATIVDSAFAYNGINGIWADTVGSARTNIDVQRTVVLKNGGDGLLTTAGASNARSFLTLRNTAFNDNGAYGVRILATFGRAVATITDNGLSGNYDGPGMLVDGADTYVFISRNGGDAIVCSNGGSVTTYQDNTVLSLGCTKILQNAQ